jgi:hypothetical protein
MTRDPAPPDRAGSWENVRMLSASVDSLTVVPDAIDEIFGPARVLVDADDAALIGTLRVHWAIAGAADGFNILVPLHPKGTQDFVENVVPILQQRGLFRTEYDGTTLSEHFVVNPASRPVDKRPSTGHITSR